jgi:hypothetical protein
MLFNRVWCLYIERYDRIGGTLYQYVHVIENVNIERRQHWAELYEDKSRGMYSVITSPNLMHHYPKLIMQKLKMSLLMPPNPLLG